MPMSLTSRLGLTASVQTWASGLAPKLKGRGSLSLAEFPDLSPTPHFTSGPPTHLAGLRGLREGAAGRAVSSSPEPTVDSPRGKHFSCLISFKPPDCADSWELRTHLGRGEPGSLGSKVKTHGNSGESGQSPVARHKGRGWDGAKSHGTPASPALLRLMNSILICSSSLP